MGVVEIKMLRQMSEYIKKDKLQNDYIQEKVGVVPIEKKMTEAGL